MNRSIVLVAFLASGICVSSDPLTATVDAVATQSAAVGGPAELVVKVTNTGPAIYHLGLVFRTTDRWYERHEMTDFGLRDRRRRLSVRLRRSCGERDQDVFASRGREYGRQLPFRACAARAGPSIRLRERPLRRGRRPRPGRDRSLGACLRARFSFEDEIAERHRRLLGLERVGALVVLLEARV